jgi:hypothetical protein
MGRSADTEVAVNILSKSEVMLHRASDLLLHVAVIAVLRLAYSVRFALEWWLVLLSCSFLFIFLYLMTLSALRVCKFINEGLIGKCV